MPNLYSETGDDLDKSQSKLIKLLNESNLVKNARQGGTKTQIVHDADAYIKSSKGGQKRQKVYNQNGKVVNPRHPRGYFKTAKKMNNSEYMNLPYIITDCK